MSTPKPAEDAGVRSLLVAYDFSDASCKPLHHGLTIARHFGAKLYVAHVVSSLGYGIAGPEALQLAAEGCQREAQSAGEMQIEKFIMHNVPAATNSSFWSSLERMATKSSKPATH